MGAEAILIVAGPLAVHVVDDAFLQPEPGTTAADHLVSGSIALAALLLAVVAATRVRPGVRAVIGLVVGVSGIVAGLEGAHAVLHGGPSRDDFTGIAALLAGAALVVIASVAGCGGLGDSDEPRVRRYVRRGLTALAAMIVLLQVGYPLTVAYVGTHVALPAPSVAGPDYEDVEIVTSDGVVLRGWVPALPQPSRGDHLSGSRKSAAVRRVLGAPRVRRAPSRPSRAGRQHR